MSMLNRGNFCKLVVIVTCLGLVACGFRLAGTADLPESLSTIHLVSRGLNDQQQDEIRGRLIQAGASVVDQPTADAVILTLTFAVLPDRRLVSGGSSGKIVERLSRTLDYNLKSSSGEVMVAQKTLSQQKDVELDDTRLLASNQEKENVTRDLEQALFKQLINQLQRI